MPYRPGVEDRSGEIMATGISGAAGTVADTIMQYAQLAKQTKAYRQMAVDGLGMDPEAVDKMTLPQLQGKMQGIAVKNAQDEAKLRQENIRQQMAMRTALGQQQVREAGAMSNYYQMADRYMAPSAAMSAVDAMNSGFPNGRAVDRAIANPGVAPRMTPEIQTMLMSRAGLNGKQRYDVARTAKMMGEISPESSPLMMEEGLGGDRVYTKGGKMTVVKASPEKKEDLTTPDSIFGEDTPEASKAFEADMKNFKPIDVQRFKKLRGNHLAELAAERLDTPENSAWLFADDDKTFRTGLAKLKGRHEREGALAIRQKVMNASGKASLLQLLMGGGMPGVMPAGAPVATAAPTRKFNPATGRIE